MIDAHIHVTDPRLPGIGSVYPLWDGPEPPLAEAPLDQMRQAGITQALAIAIADIGKAVRYAHGTRPDRFLCRSDWPMAPMAGYRTLIEAIVPPDARRAIFHDNARALFDL